MLHSWQRCFLGWTGLAIRAFATRFAIVRALKTAPQPDARTGCLQPDPRFWGPARRNLVRKLTGPPVRFCLPTNRAPVKQQCTAEQADCHYRGSVDIAYAKGVGSRDWRQRPAAGRPRRGAGEVLRCGRAPSAGLARGRFPISPKPPPSLYSFSVGSSESGFAFYFVPTPIHLVSRERVGWRPTLGAPDLRNGSRRLRTHPRNRLPTGYDHGSKATTPVWPGP
jgi:hypothetical protein